MGDGWCRGWAVQGVGGAWGWVYVPPSWDVQPKDRSLVSCLWKISFILWSRLLFRATVAGPPCGVGGNITLPLLPLRKPVPRTLGTGVLGEAATATVPAPAPAPAPAGSVRGFGLAVGVVRSVVVCATLDGCGVLHSSWISLFWGVLCGLLVF